VTRDSITILKGKPKVFVNRDKNKKSIVSVSPAENSKPPSGGTITDDRCLTQIRDAEHSETHRTLAVHERTSVHFLVLQGCLMSITEITEYRYFSSLKPIHELIYKSE